MAAQMSTQKPQTINLHRLCRLIAVRIIQVDPVGKTLVNSRKLKTKSVYVIFLFFLRLATFKSSKTSPTLSLAMSAFSQLQMRERAKNQLAPSELPAGHVVVVVAVTNAMQCNAKKKKKCR